MSSLIDFVGDVVSTVLVSDSHDVERLYLLTRDRRLIQLTLQFFRHGHLRRRRVYFRLHRSYATRSVHGGMAASGAGGTCDFAWGFPRAGETA